MNPRTTSIEARYVIQRKGLIPYASVTSRYSRNVRMTIAATTKSKTGQGALNTSSSTTGISATAVRTLFILVGAAWSRLVQAAVTALALLEFLDGFQQMQAVEIRPQRFGYIDFGIRGLPEKKV